MTILFENVQFTDAWPGATTKRTPAQRWGDWINVKSFGAKGDNSTDDTTAIQAAIDSISSPRAGQNGLYVGTLYFPPGSYKITAPLTLNYAGQFSIIFKGDGGASLLFGNFSGYLISRIPAGGANGGTGPFVVEEMTLINSHAAGGCIKLNNCLNNQIRACTVQAGLIGINAFDVVAPGNYGLLLVNCQLSGLAFPPAANSYGVVSDEETCMISCDVTNWDNGARFSGAGCAILQCRFEGNNTGVMLGKEISGTVHASSGVLVGGLSFEANDVAMNIAAASAGHIGGVSVQGSVNAPSGQSTHGVRIGAVQNLTLSGVSCGGNFSTACFAFDTAPITTTFIGCGAGNSYGGASLLWSYNAAGLGGMGGAQFIQCNNPETDGTNRASCTVANAPADPGLGQRCWFNNSNTATFRATVAAGGSNLVEGVYNGTNWTVAG